MTTACLRLVFIVSAAVLMTRTATGQSVSVQGQVSTWFTLNDADPSTPGIGVRSRMRLLNASALCAPRV